MPRKESKVPQIIQNETRARWLTLLTFIQTYQQKNNGATPSVAQMAKIIGVSAGSTVRYHLDRMEHEDLIRYLNKNPMMIEVLVDTDQQMNLPLKEDEPVKAPTPVRPQADTKEKVYSFVERARCIARSVQMHWEEYGCPPTAGYIAYACGYRNGNGISPTVLQMVERGWMEHKPRHKGDYKLTQLGKSKLLDPVAVWTKDPEPEPEPEPEPQQPEPQGDPGDETTEERDISWPEAPAHLRTVHEFDDKDLVFELIDRGYTVTKPR